MIQTALIFGTCDGFSGLLPMIQTALIFGTCDGFSGLLPMIQAALIFGTCDGFSGLCLWSQLHLFLELATNSLGFAYDSSCTLCPWSLTTKFLELATDALGFARGWSCPGLWANLLIFGTRDRFSGLCLWLKLHHVSLVLGGWTRPTYFCISRRIVWVDWAAIVKFCGRAHKIWQCQPQSNTGSVTIYEIKRPGPTAED